MVKIFELAFPQEVRLYYRPHFSLPSVSLSPILTINIDGKECGEEAMDWKHLLAYITGTVDQELLLRKEYLVTENRLLRSQITGHIQLTDGERRTLAEIGQRLGKQALAEKWRASSSPIPSSLGTASSWPRSLMAPHNARLLVVP